MHMHTHMHTSTTQDYETAQLGWERRELELEQQLEQFKQQQGRMASAADRLERASGNIPDPHVSLIHLLTKITSLFRFQAECGIWIVSSVNMLLNSVPIPT